MRDDKFWPRDVAEVEDKVSLINEPLSAPDGTTALPVCYLERPLHAVLCESLKQTRELLARLEAKGVYVPRDDQRATVRDLRGTRVSVTPARYPSGQRIATASGTSVTSRREWHCKQRFAELQPTASRCRRKSAHAARRCG
jgi:hypothetical protein